MMSLNSDLLSRGFRDSTDDELKADLWKQEVENNRLRARIAEFEAPQAAPDVDAERYRFMRKAAFNERLLRHLMNAGEPETEQEFDLFTDKAMLQASQEENGK